MQPVEPRGHEQRLEEAQPDPQVRVHERGPRGVDRGRDRHARDRESDQQQQDRRQQVAQRVLARVRAEGREPVERRARVVDLVEPPERVDPVQQQMGGVGPEVVEHDREPDRERNGERAQRRPQDCAGLGQPGDRVAHREAERHRARREIEEVGAGAAAQQRGGFEAQPGAALDERDRGERAGEQEVHGSPLLRGFGGRTFRAGDPLRVRAAR